jgi:dynein heavy chain
MAELHLSISEANVQFKIRERRHNYTTPTSFLELIKFYTNLLGKKRDKITDQINRLEIGLQTMKDTAEQVDGLKQLLVVKMEDVEVEKKNTDILIENVGKESEIAQVEKDKAKIQEDETNEATRMANEEKAKAEAELAEAVPAMKAAEEAVNCLTKGSI